MHYIPIRTRRSYTWNTHGTVCASQQRDDHLSIRAEVLREYGFLHICSATRCDFPASKVLRDLRPKLSPI